MPHLGRWSAVVGLGGGLLIGLSAGAPAQALRTARATPESQRVPAPAVATERPGTVILRALMADPVTAPYRFATSEQNGKIRLSGRVGTKQIHDQAIQVATSVWPSIDDRLVIDTAETYRAAATASMNAAAAAQPGVPGPRMQPTTALNTTLPGWGATLPYVYPPPLFGYYDDPFYGFEPPAISYPPWWGALSARRLAETAQSVAPVADGADGAAAVVPAEGSVLPDDTIEMAIDPRGVAVLRGSVATLADKLSIGQKLSQTPGITEIRNQLTVREANGINLPPGGGALPQAGVANRDVPPPPPMPDVPAPKAEAVAPKAESPVPNPGPPIRFNENALTTKVTEALAKRPALAKLPIHAFVIDGIAYLTGKVPTVLEDLAAFRAAQQVPGVRLVDDRLEFTVPDGVAQNPLLEKARPQDVEPYLEGQIQRQLGDQAHIDRIHLRGDGLEIRGTLARADDRQRVEAILRSMPLLRGFRLEPQFAVE